MARVAKGVDLRASLEGHADMDGKALGVERRRRWSRNEKARIVEETLLIWTSRGLWPMRSTSHKPVRLFSALLSI